SNPLTESALRDHKRVGSPRGRGEARRRSRRAVTVSRVYGAPGRSRTCDPRIRSSPRGWQATGVFSDTSVLDSSTAWVHQSAANRAPLQLAGDTLSDTRRISRAPHGKLAPRSRHVSNSLS